MPSHSEQEKKKGGFLATMTRGIADYVIGMAVFLLVFAIYDSTLGPLDLNTNTGVFTAVILSLLGSFIGGLVAGIITRHGVPIKLYLLMNVFVIIGSLMLLNSLASVFSDVSTACQDPLSFLGQLACGFYIIFIGGLLLFIVFLMAFLIILLLFHVAGTHVGASLR